MKKSAIIILCGFVIAYLWAIPTKQEPIILTQVDGSQIIVIPHGDENYHYYTTLDGIRLALDDDGMYREATETEITSEETKGAAKLQARNATRIKRSALYKKVSCTGAKKGLVILVNFTDVKMITADAQTAFYNLFNEKGYSVNKQIGSVRDYFYDQSYGKLTIDFDVVGPYTISHAMSYYGGNDKSGNDMRPATMASEAIKLADGDVNYKDYDWDDDGEVDQVYIIYAGYSESANTATLANAIWPHEWSLESAKENKEGNGALMLDGTWVNTYACNSELINSVGSTLCTVGTPIHEFSHCLGLPDLYDVNYGGGFGMSYWSVMANGSYNGPTGNGEVPAGFTSYERMFTGWLEPIELSSARYVANMQPIETNAEAYIIYNDANYNEYYLLENRQLTRWDSYLSGHGMLVIHVDYDEDAWYNNNVNTDVSHQRCTIIPADNKFTTSSLAGDPYPGTYEKTALTDTSTPAAKLYNANSDGNKYISKPITEIAESNGVISFTCMGGLIEDINKDGFVDTEDVLRIYGLMQSGESTSDADVNQDGTVDTQDVLTLYEYMKNN